MTGPIRQAIRSQFPTTAKRVSSPKGGFHQVNLSREIPLPARHEMGMRRRPARRLVSVFLRRRLEVTAVKEAVVFDAAHLEQLMRSRRWDDAEYYLERFLVPVPCDERSPVAHKLFIDIRIIRILAKIAAGGQEGSEVAALFKKPPPSSFGSRLKTFITQMKSDKTRPNLLKIWHKIELEGVDMIMDLVARCPELKGDHVTVPPEMPRLWVAAQHRLRQGPSRCKKKAAGRPPHVLACAFVQKRLLSTQGRKRRKSNNSEQPSENAETSVEKQDRTQL
ncbi:hypothetical protein EJB05_03826 [Eragrostis curvula]|uniref:Uncharacterized protein n=1 Tax=Eragrostis curvula TaxID=38414 RepID=A0A5J9W8D2_9POAL|nr:hypothetical protein EJB05_03826 [Eragrostis curvula]